MDELFRFVALRPPTPLSDPIIIDGTSPLAISLAEARSAPNGLAEMHQLAQSFAQSDGFVGDASSLNLPLDRLADRLDESNGLGLTSAAELIESILDSTAAEVNQSPEFSADLARLQDSLLAIKLTPPDDGDAALVLRLLRAANIVQQVASGRDEIRVSTGNLMLLPASIFPLPPGPVTVAEPPDVPLGPSPEQTQKNLVARAKALDEALQALRVTRQQAFASSTQELTEVRVAESAARFDGEEERANVSFSVEANTVLLDSASISRLAPRVQKTLKNIGLDLAATPLPSLLHSLELHLGEVESLIDFTELRPELYFLGSGPYNPLTEPRPKDDVSDPSPAVLTAPPVTHGKVKPAGMADLLVVRQHVLGYAAGEVAYVENVAQGETLVRTTHRSETVEDVTVTVQETSREQQRDVQATDRFDLRRESSEVLRSDSARQPGSPGSAAYGVLVETGSSTEQAQKAAETFGRDVATRAVSRVSERLRTDTTHRRVQEFSEDVRHEFDNAAGAGHEIYVYQWLDRVVQAQVFSYGKRLFYDFVLPEPGALFLKALTWRHLPDGPFVKPAPFTLKSSQINEINYLYYTAGYGATGVEPPPEPQIVVSQPFASVSQNSFSTIPEIRAIQQAVPVKITIPPGYQAVTAKVLNNRSGWGADPSFFYIMIGTQIINLSTDTRNLFPLDGEVGSIPVTLASSDNQYVYIVNVEIWCEPTVHCLDVWRQRTCDAILQASRQRLAEYEERAANLRASIRMDALNFNLERKRSTEREELERACLAVLTGQHFDGLSAIEHSPQGYPQSFLPNVEPLGRYVRFLQQAFEWEQMTWHYYPYFWGRKQYWLDKLLLDDNDPQFRDFLRSGSVRVLLAVRPGFEGAVAHFMDTGTVPTVEELGQMASKLYLSFLTEDTGSDLAIESAKPYGEPWQLRAPTALVKLRGDKTLPAWTSQANAMGGIDWNARAGDPL
jgi:hypothetical protein